MSISLMNVVVFVDRMSIPLLVDGENFPYVCFPPLPSFPPFIPNLNPQFSSHLVPNITKRKFKLSNKI